MWWQIIWLRGREQEALCVLLWAARSRTYIEWVSEGGMIAWEGGGRVDGGALIWTRAVTHMAECYTIVLVQMKEKERKLPKKAERVQPPCCFNGAACLFKMKCLALVYDSGYNPKSKSIENYVMHEWRHRKFYDKPVTKCRYHISLSLFLCNPKTHQKLKVVMCFQNDRPVFQKLNNSLPYKKRRL